LGGRAVEVSRGSADLQAEEAEEAKGQSHVRSRGTRQAATIFSNRRPGRAQIGGCGGVE